MTPPGSPTCVPWSALALSATPSTALQPTSGCRLAARSGWLASTPLSITQTVAGLALAAKPGAAPPVLTSQADGAEMRGRAHCAGR